MFLQQLFICKRIFYHCNNALKIKLSWKSKRKVKVINGQEIRYNEKSICMVCFNGISRLYLIVTMEYRYLNTTIRNLFSLNSSIIFILFCMQVV